MRIRPARILFAFAIGIGCTVVFTFPSWSSGMVRGSGQSLESDGSVLPRLVIESKQGRTPLLAKSLIHCGRLPQLTFFDVAFKYLREILLRDCCGERLVIKH